MSNFMHHTSLGKQANMYAGISWCLVHLMTADSIHMEKVMAEIARVNDKYGGGTHVNPIQKEIISLHQAH